MRNEDHVRAVAEFAKSCRSISGAVRSIEDCGYEMHDEIRSLSRMIDIQAWTMESMCSLLISAMTSKSDRQSLDLDPVEWDQDRYEKLVCRILKSI